MKYKKLVMILSIIIAMAVVLVACANESSETYNDYTINNETDGYYASNVQDYTNSNETGSYYDYTNNSQDDATNNATESTAIPEPTIPPAESDIPAYITIQGMQFSTQLTELNMTRWFLEDYDIKPLRYMTNLTSLDLNHNPISDLSPLAGLTNLTELRLLDNTATDLSPLANLTNLTSLDISLRHFYDTDITPLIGLTGLTSFHLSLGGNQIEDISRLAYLPRLTRLDLWHNNISDLTPLAGLTNLRHLDLSGDNQISDITPLANLTNISTLFMHYSPGVDMALLYNTPPHVAPPAVPAANVNPHLFANALTNFFVNLTAPDSSRYTMPYSYHAVLVDVDGQGTPGMVASRWTFEGDRRHPFAFGNFISIWPHFTQRLFFMYDNQLHEVDGQWGVTPSGRLVALSFVGACDILMTEYILLSVDDGSLVGVKSVSITEQTWGDNFYSVNYHINEFLASDFEQSQSLTHAEFDEMMARYGLHGTRINSWELPNDTYMVLAMEAE